MELKMPASDLLSTLAIPSDFGPSDDSSGQSALPELPEELVAAIVHHLDYQTLLALRRTCKQFNRITAIIFGQTFIRHLPIGLRTTSLQALLDISKHEFFAGFVREIVVDPELLTIHECSCRFSRCPKCHGDGMGPVQRFHPGSFGGLSQPDPFLDMFCQCRKSRTSRPCCKLYGQEEEETTMVGLEHPLQMLTEALANLKSRNQSIALAVGDCNRSAIGVQSVLRNHDHAWGTNMQTTMVFDVLFKAASRSRVTVKELSIRNEPHQCPHLWSRGRNLDIRGLNTKVAPDICSRLQTMKLQLRGDLLFKFWKDALAFIASAGKTLEVLHLNIVDAHEFIELEYKKHTDVNNDVDMDVDVDIDVSGEIEAETAQIYSMVFRELVSSLDPSTRLLEVKLSGVTGWESQFMELLAKMQDSPFRRLELSDCYMYVTTGLVAELNPNGAGWLKTSRKRSSRWVID